MEDGLGWSILVLFLLPSVPLKPSPLSLSDRSRRKRSKIQAEDRGDLHDNGLE
uniref:Uncharacterized protein n=1 Tax=Oryza sativa subsp. japonica TaxID=39947 RepID=Q6ERM9_ORYSJ|nr:hypothetical protein [Oryza sativa Japonica Group]